MTVGAYDGMALIYDIIAKSGGKIDADKAMDVVKGWKTQSPRGPISIDPQTRDIVQTIYVRRVEKKSGELWNVEFDKFENVRRPGQAALSRKARNRRGARPPRNPGNEDPGRHHRRRALGTAVVPAPRTRGIETVVLEKHTREHVLGRIRAGVLEHGFAALMREAQVGDRMDREGQIHEGIYIAHDGHEAARGPEGADRRQSVIVYGQTELTRDLYDGRDRLRAAS